MINAMPLVIHHAHKDEIIEPGSRVVYFDPGLPLVDKPNTLRPIAGVAPRWAQVVALSLDERMDLKLWVHPGDTPIEHRAVRHATTGQAKTWASHEEAFEMGVFDNC